MNKETYESTIRIQFEMITELINKVDDLENIIKEALDKLTIKQIRFISEKDYVLDDNDLDEIMKILEKEV